MAVMKTTLGEIRSIVRDYYDLIKGYSEFNVYLTTNVHEAENYATRAAVDDRSKAVVLKVIVRDPTRFVLDEDTVNWMTVINPDGEKENIHFRNNNWRKWSNSANIAQQFQSKITKEINKEQTVAYKGNILPKDISVYEEYKPVAMSSDPGQEEYDQAMEKTLAGIKRPGLKSVNTGVRAQVKPAKKKTTTMSTQKSGGRTVYGTKSGSNVHTRIKGHAYGPVGFKSRARKGEKVSTSVGPDGKLYVNDPENGWNQVWDEIEG